MTDMESLMVIRSVFQRAVCPEDVFGALTGDRMAGLRSQYRRLLKAVHPDTNPGDKGLAADLLISLNRWHEEAQHKIAVSTYGDHKPVIATGGARALPRAELKVGRHTLVLNEAFAEGTFATCRYAEYGDDADHFLFAKIARQPTDSDLLEREYRTLKALWRPDPVPAREAYYATYRLYTPFPVLTFTVLGTDGQKHRANLLSTSLGERHTAQQLREGPFQSGLPPEHVWWIYRRLLSVLWMAHTRGLVHGAVTPDHVLVLPDPQHGIMLLDWCFSTEAGKTVPATDPHWAEFVPPEVNRREPATAATDLYGAAAVAVYLLGGEVTTKVIPDAVPAGLRALLLRCLDPVASRRPQDAGDLYDEVARHMGPRRYAAFHVPH